MKTSYNNKGEKTPNKKLTIEEIKELPIAVMRLEIAISPQGFPVVKNHKCLFSPYDLNNNERFIKVYLLNDKNQIFQKLIVNKDIIRHIQFLKDKLTNKTIRVFNQMVELQDKKEILQNEAQRIKQE